MQTIDHQRLNFHKKTPAPLNEHRQQKRTTVPIAASTTKNNY